MWITASAHITMWIATSYRPHLPGPRPPWGSNRRPSRNLLASNDGRMVCNRQRNLPGKSHRGRGQFVRRTARGGRTILCTLPLGT